MVMRPLLGTTLLVLALLGGCADDEPSAPLGGPAPPSMSVVHATAAGGEVADEVTVLKDDAAVAEYAGRFRGALPDKIARAAAGLEVPAGHELVAAVVAVGCDVPTGVDLVGEGADATFVPQKVVSPHPECFAPVTTVALGVVPA
jgi:hypothetical protein